MSKQVPISIKLAMTADQKHEIHVANRFKTSQSEFEESRYSGQVEKKAFIGTICGGCEKDISGQLCRYNVRLAKAFCLRCGCKQICIAPAEQFLMKDYPTELVVTKLPPAKTF